MSQAENLSAHVGPSPSIVCPPHEHRSVELSMGHWLWKASQVQVPWTQRCPAGHGGSQGAHAPSVQNDWSPQAHVVPQPSSTAHSVPPSQSGTQLQVPPWHVSGAWHDPHEPTHPSGPHGLAAAQTGVQRRFFLRRFLASASHPEATRPRDPSRAPVRPARARRRETWYFA